MPSDETKQSTEEIAKLFLEHGADYLSNADTDDFMRGQFYAFLNETPREHLQEKIDEISGYLDKGLLQKSVTAIQMKNTREAFYDMAKQYADKNGLYLRVSSPEFAKAEARRLASYLDSTKEQPASFRTVFLEAAHKSNPDSFQATIQELEKGLTLEQKGQLDALVMEHNGRSRNKFETETVLLSDADKAHSWQSKGADSFFEKKCRDFQERLEDLKAERLRPKDKYDRGIVHKALRTLINLQGLVTEIANFVSETMKYYESDKKNRAMDKQQAIPHASAFYDVMQDAYKTKGIELGALLNSGKIDITTAEDVFITDIAYIKSLKAKDQQELFSSYAGSIKDALKMEGLTYECKNALMTFVANYENGNYDEKITEKIAKKEFRWDDVTIQPGREQTPPEQQKQDGPAVGTGESQTIKKGSPQEKLFMEGKRTEDAYKIGLAVAARTDLNADEKMMDFVTKVSAFAHKYEGQLTNDQVNAYAAIAVAVLLTKDNSQELANHMMQFNTKYFSADSEPAHIKMLLDASARIDLAGVKDNNPMREVLHEAISHALNNKTAEEKQAILSAIADRVKQPKQQYLLTLEAKQLGLSAQAPNALKSEKKQQERIEILAEKYIRKASTNRNLETAQDFIALCDRIPAEDGAQLVFGKTKELLAGNTKAVQLLEQDAKAFNKLNKENHLPTIPFTKPGPILQTQPKTNTERSKAEKNADNRPKTRAEILRQSFEREKNLHAFDPAETELKSQVMAEKQEAQKTTPSITEEQLVKAFNTGQNQEHLFAQFINGKSMDEIQQAVTMLDNSISEEGCFRLSAALEDCGLSNITAPYTEKLMDSIYQDMDER